jgi:phenylacetate-CoA ligase
MAAGDLTWPAFIETRGAALRGAVNGLAESQGWSADELRAGQQRQLTHVLRFAAKNVPWYGRATWARPLLEAVAARPTEFWERWQAIPLLTKPELREHGALLKPRSLPAAHLPLATLRTSGSVGIPVEVQTTAVSRLAWNALSVREHLWQGRDFGKRLGVIRSRSPKDRAPGGMDASNWGPPVATLFATGKASVIHISYELELLVHWLQRFDPHYLLTYPSLALELLDTLGAAGKPPSLEEMRLISEPVDPALEQRLAQEWNVRTSDIYSANEVGHIAFRCREGRLHVQSEAILMEVLDDAGRPCGPGMAGRVVVTPLHNIASPFMRYEIGDYATVGAACPCGRSHPVIEKVLGRVRNLVRTPDGKSYWPVALVRIKSVAPIRQFQYVQTTLDTVELRLVLDRPLTPAEEQEATRQAHGVLQYPFRIVIRGVDSIPRGPTGKFEEFLSLVTAPPPAA